jgi:hypothetical protein
LASDCKDNIFLFEKREKERQPGLRRNGMSSGGIVQSSDQALAVAVLCAKNLREL